MTAPAPVVPLAPETRDAIAELFLSGRRVSEVIAHGLTRRPGWRRPDVVDLLAAKGWQLDSDGRIPRKHRTTAVTPIGTLPGAPQPAPGTAVSWPDKGTVTVGPRAEDGPSKLIERGKASGNKRVQTLAEKAQAALDVLAAALKADEEHAGIRARLAELDAERAKLLAKLGAPAATPKPRAATDPSNRPPINHGSWGGFLAEKARGIEHCGPCIAAKDETMEQRRAARAGRA